MKIIFSPTKSQISYATNREYETTEIIYKKHAYQLRDKLKSLSKEELVEILKISSVIAEKTYQQYQVSNIADTPAIRLFNGISFKQLNYIYSPKEYDYLQNHLVILSALCGVLRPFDVVYPYRLDMNNIVDISGFGHKNLYDYWKIPVQEYFKNEKIILNLASQEYAKMLLPECSDKMITIHFVILQDGKIKKNSTIIKKQRGKMLQFCIDNALKKPELLKQYTADNYIYDVKLSDAYNYYFVDKK